MAPDLFSWASTPRCVVSAFRSLAQRKGPAFDAIDASLDLLRSRSDCNGKVAVVGFCMGGGFALVAAAAGKVQASSVNYGMVPLDVDQLLRQSCPIIGSFGAHDRTLKGAAAKLTRSAERNGIAHDIKEYPEAGHAFMDPYSGFRGWLMARLGMTCHLRSAKDAQARILAFFQEHLH